MPAAMTFVTGSAAEIVVASVVEAGSGFDDCISIADARRLDVSRRPANFFIDKCGFHRNLDPNLER
jgi:hypothetical protein